MAGEARTIFKHANTIVTWRKNPWVGHLGFKNGMNSNNMANTFVKSLLRAAVAINHVAVNHVLIQDTPTEAILEKGERQRLSISDSNL